MPQATRELDSIRGFLGIKANDECRGVDCIDDVSVVGVGSEVLIVLRQTEEKEDSRLEGRSP